MSKTKGFEVKCERYSTHLDELLGCSQNAIGADYSPGFEYIDLNRIRDRNEPHAVAKISEKYLDNSGGFFFYPEAVSCLEAFVKKKLDIQGGTTEVTYKPDTGELHMRVGCTL